MRMRRLFALLIPLACAALFIRLGFWQLERGRERAEINEGLSTRLTEAPMPFDALPADTLAQRWRRVTLAGRFRYDLEQVQAARTNGGSPGVHLLTPLQREGNDTLVIVSRGWVYSADAASANLARWRESEQVELSGYALPLPPEGIPAPPDRPPPDRPLPLRSVNRAALESRLGTPVSPVHVVMTSESVARADSVPRRLESPVIDAGPHLSYALQWFAFATIAVIGGVSLFRATRPAE